MLVGRLHGVSLLQFSSYLQLRLLSCYLVFQNLQGMSNLTMWLQLLCFGLDKKLINTFRWLFKRGREEEAIEVMCAVYNLSPDDPYITSEVAAIKHALSVESGVRSHLALFKSDKLMTRRRIMLAYFGLFMNQMVGINMVVYYSPTLLVTNVHLNARTAQIIAGL